MNIIFSDHVWKDYLHWQKNDRNLLKRVDNIIKEISRNPHTGTAKPEPLKHALSGYWSRRINGEHRVVYKVNGDNLFIVQLRYHY